jgi:hypothetical protein
MSAFLFVVIVVAILGIGIALTTRFRPTKAMEQIGRRGGGSLTGGQSDADARERSEERPVDDSEERVPLRPLRGRSD